MKDKIMINGRSQDWHEGMTVRDALNMMKYTFPMLVIKINGELVPKDAYDTTIIPEGADVMIVHLISGG